MKKNVSQNFKRHRTQVFNCTGFITQAHTHTHNEKKSSHFIFQVSLRLHYAANQNLINFETK